MSARQKPYSLCLPIQRESAAKIILTLGEFKGVVGGGGGVACCWHASGGGRGVRRGVWRNNSKPGQVSYHQQFYPSEK